MDTSSVIVHIKSTDIYEDIAKNVESTFENSNYQFHIRTLKWINER